MAGSLIDKGTDPTTGAHKWGCRVYLGRVNGKRKYRYETFHGTKKQAEKHLRKMQGKADRGEYLNEADSSGSESLSEYLASWLDRVKPTVRRRTHSTYKYALDNRVIPEIGSLPLEQVTPEVLIDLYATLSREGGENGEPLSSRTVRKAHEVLRNALEWAVEAGKIARNPAKTRSAQKSLPKIENTERATVRPDQMSAFLTEAKSNPFGAYFVLLLGSGLRPEEALALRWSDYDGRRVRVNRVLEDRTLMEGKVSPFAEPKTDKSRRAVALPSWAVEALEAHREAQAEQREKAGAAWQDNDLIFPDEAGRPLRQHRTVRPWKELKDSANLDAGQPSPMRIYDLRHSCATLLLANGEPVKVVQERLGHSTAVLTMDRYAHVIEGAQQRAAESLDRIADENGGS